MNAPLSQVFDLRTHFETVFRGKPSTNINCLIKMGTVVAVFEVKSTMLLLTAPSL